MIRLLLFIVLCTAQIAHADHGECLEEAVEEMNDLYRTGCGCEDGIFNAISSSMIGWGVGLFVGIALLTGLLHNAHQGSQTTSNNSPESLN